MNNFLQIISGEKLRPAPSTKPAPMPTEKYESIDKNSQRYETKLDKSGDKLQDWKEKHQRTCFRILLSCAEGPRTHIRAMKDAVLMWKALKMYVLVDKVVMNRQVRLAEEYEKS